jgi:putative ABC transport system permease protein
MLRNYLKIPWRNLTKNKISSLINIGGLTIGMAVAMLIGLWIYSELTFDRNFPNYPRIAQAMQNQWINNETATWDGEAYPLGPELRNKYGSDFKHVIMSGWTASHILSVNEKNIQESGNYMEPGVTDMLSLDMLKGSRDGLQLPESILLSQSAAKALFGAADPMDKSVEVDHKLTAKVSGVYRDLPFNSSFGDLLFICPWQLLVRAEHYDTQFNNPWGASWFQVLVQIADKADMDRVSAKIKNVKLNALDNKKNDDARFRPVIFLHPMSKWHLYSNFKNGVIAGGRIQNVWLFGIIGIFVLLLACINFMNLSTARSEKRAREVGIRKSIGSLRRQVIAQFYCESLLIAVFAFFASLVVVQLALPFFNQVADKKMSILWKSPLFWVAGIGFGLMTGLIAGSYPALYLSSFRPVKVLKGTFRVGRLAAIPRQVLVVLQFTVSAVLIIGTIIVYKQIQFAKDRPVGYDKNNLIRIPLQTEEINKQYPAIRNELMESGVVASVAESESRITDIYITNSGLTWKGKDPSLQEEFVTLGITPEFGKTVGWKIKEGRDFSASFLSDSSGFIINEAAQRYLGFKSPVGETITWNGNGNFRIIGVVKDMVTRSPYDPIKQTFFYLRNGPLSNLLIRINPNRSASAALSKIAAIYHKYAPSTPFEFQYVDEEYARNFDNEERIGKLASCFAGLAVFISCLGLFGMASFVAEQRIKEIGVRKVLGASVFNLWRLLSRDFIVLIIISLFLAIPLAYYFMHRWLLNYPYRENIAWWIFGITAIGAIVTTMATVSYQSIKAALMNPVRSLRSE